MGQLAVAVMAFDEAELLPRCLESIQALGEQAEIHVSVDQRTHDDSAAVAARYTEHLYTHQGVPTEPVEEPAGTSSAHSVNSMARMRNDVLEQVEQNSEAQWILWLDADEWIGEEGDDLIRVIEGLETAAGGEGTPRHDEGPTATAPEAEEVKAILVRMVDLDPESGEPFRTWHNIKIIRRGQRFRRRRHEAIFTAPTRAKCETTIHHQKVIAGAHAHRRLSQKLDEIAYLGDWREFRDQRAAYYLGDCLRNRGAYDHAELWFARATEIDEQYDAYRELAAVRLAEARFRLGNPAGARRACLIALEANWRRGDAYFDLGTIAANSGKLEEAIRWYEIAASNGPPGTIQEINLGKITDMPYLRLAQIAEQQGRYQEAFDYVEQARSFGNNRPEFHEIRVRLQERLAPEPVARSREGLIIVSGGMRTGTTWLCDVLNRLGRHVNEPFLLAERGYYHGGQAGSLPHGTADGNDTGGNGVPPLQEETGGGQCSEGFAKACRELLPPWRPRRGNFPPEAREQLVALYRRFSDEWPEAIGYKDALPQISAEAHPNAQIILLQRRTASVLASISKRFGIGPEVAQIGEAYPDVWNELLPDRYAEADAETRRRIEQAAQNVMLQMLDPSEVRDVLAAQGRDPEQALRILDFEDLTANYQHIVPELLEWLGYDPATAYEMVKPLLHAPPNRPAEAPEERRRFAEIAEEIERRYWRVEKRPEMELVGEA